MYRIVCLTWDEDRKSFQAMGTDYDPMTKDEAWNIVRELTDDAIENSSQDRWTIELDRPN